MQDGYRIKGVAIRSQVLRDVAQLYLGIITGPQEL